MIFLFLFQIIIGIRILKHKKFQEAVKKTYETLTQTTKKTYLILKQTAVQIQTICKTLTQMIIKVYKTVIRAIKSVTIPAVKFLIQKLLAWYKWLRILMQDILSIDKEVMKSLLKEIKAELKIENLQCKTKKPEDKQTVSKQSMQEIKENFK